MKKALAGAFLGLPIGGAVMLYYSWVSGAISFRLVPPGIESFEFTPQLTLMLFQCLLTGVIAGSVTYATGRWRPGIIAAITFGFGLGFIYVGQDVPPWGMIAALAMLLPVLIAAVLSSLTAVVLRMRESAFMGNIDSVEMRSDAITSKNKGRAFLLGLAGLILFSAGMVAEYIEAYAGNNFEMYEAISFYSVTIAIILFIIAIAMAMSANEVNKTT